MDGITDSMDMNLGRLWEMGRDRAAWRAPVHGKLCNIAFIVSDYLILTTV